MNHGVSFRAPLTLDELSRRGLLWHGNQCIPLNQLDASLCTDVYSAFRACQSKLYVYPIPSYTLPPLLVAALIVNTFGRLERKDLVPRLLFYTGIDGRDIYRELGIGPQREKISETFGFIRLDSLGLPIDKVKLTSSHALVVTGHCTLPRDVGYRPDVVVVDAKAFDVSALAELLAAARKRWPHCCIYAVTGDPLTPLLKISSEQGWRIADMLRSAPNIPHPPADPAFGSIAIQLNNAAAGVRWRIHIVAGAPSESWHELNDLTELAKKNAKTSQTARLFLFACKWLASLSVLPSEYEKYRMQSMRSFEDLIADLRGVARYESRTARLIAGGSSLLETIREDLEHSNHKREIGRAHV